MPSYRKRVCQQHCLRPGPSRCRRRHCVGSIDVPIGQSNCVLTHAPCMRPPIPFRKPSACPRRTNFGMIRCRKGPLPPCNGPITCDGELIKSNCPATTATDGDCFRYRYIQEDDCDLIRYFQGTLNAPCQTEPVRILVRECSNREPPCPFSNPYSTNQPCPNAPPSCSNPPPDCVSSPCPFVPPTYCKFIPPYLSFEPPCPSYPPCPSLSPPCRNSPPECPGSPLSCPKSLPPCFDAPCPNDPMIDDVTCTNTVLVEPCSNLPPCSNEPTYPAQISVSVDCVPTINSLGTMCSQRNVSFGCEPPPCPSSLQISRKCQANFKDSLDSCSCPGSFMSIGIPNKTGNPCVPQPPCPAKTHQSCMMSVRPPCSGEQTDLPKGKVDCKCKKKNKKEKEKNKSKITCKCTKNSKKKKVNRRVMANGKLCECQTSDGSGTSVHSKSQEICYFDAGVGTSFLRTIEGQDTGVDARIDTGSDTRIDTRTDTGSDTRIDTGNRSNQSLVKKSLEKIKTIFEKKKSCDKMEKKQKKDSSNQRDIVTASLLRTADIAKEGECDCCYPPAFKKLYCSGNDTGNCSCKTDVTE